MLGSDSLPPQPPRSRSLRRLVVDDADRPEGSGTEDPRSKEVHTSPKSDDRRRRRDAYRSHSPTEENRHTSKSPPGPHSSSQHASKPKSPLPKSPKQQIKSSRSPRLRSSPNTKSPANARRIKSKTVPAAMKNSFPGLEQQTKSKKVQSDDEESMPGLVDDSLIRETKAGFRGGKQWNIMEDTPGGHAPEKMQIVSGIEFYDEEDATSWRPGVEEPLEEDDDIHEEEEMEFGDLERSSLRRQSLPSDPQVIAGDRFDPSFKNHDMWGTDDEADKILMGSSADCSILSEGDLEEAGATALGGKVDDQEISEHEELIEDIDDDKSSNVSKTPATAKRSGGTRRTDNMSPLPNLEADSAHKDGEVEDESLPHPAAVPEDGPLDSPKKKAPRRRKKSQSSTPSSVAHSHRRHSSALERGKGSNSGRSSKQRTRTSGSRRHSGMERGTMRGSDRSRKVPDVIAASPNNDGVSYVRSPMSSSLTSTPTSMQSSSRQQQQRITALRSMLTQQSPRRRRNKPLQLHVNRDNATTDDDGDEHTLGASTITTNFSTTQRTMGDNTVSTRSLFKSERMSVSETLTIPQRRRADSDSESERSANRDSGLLSTPEKETSIDHPFPRESSPGKRDLKTALRRPSGEGDDLLAMVETVQSHTSDESFSEGSEFQKWKQENASDLISPKASIRKKTEGGESQFLQLNPQSEGVLVDSKVATVPNIDDPLDDPSGQRNLAKLEELFGHNDEARDSFDMEKLPPRPDFSQDTQHAPDSPGGVHTKVKKKKSRLSLFRRVKSWKGVVALSDDEGDDE